MFRKTAFACLVAGSLSSLAMLAATSANAATATTTFNVTANIVASCTIAATDLAFGAYDPFAGPPLNGTSTVTVTCTNTTPYDVGLDGGGGSVAARRMLNGASPLTFQLYSDAGRTVVWGETLLTDTVTGTGNGAAQPLTVFGQVPAGQTTAPVGAYTEVITATITY